ncbi:short chain dehydrogenase/oxidoreductase CpoX2 [Aspergillus carlsbadensis]|nr:short chain dehydrogenase/oxidoreductase CpoX2 [Aspergillus carlsbadensis]
MSSLASKVFVVTGGASGMGLATCRKLAEKGARAICIGDYNDTAFDAVHEDLNQINPRTEVTLTKLDVSSSTQVKAWIDGVVAKYQALDGALNAAGVAESLRAGKRLEILEESDEAWRRTIGVNLDGVFYCSREQVRAMVQLPPAPRSIVNIASMLPYLHTGNLYAYGASKAGVVHLSSNLAVDVAKYGIRVNSICPGLTTSAMYKQFIPEENESCVPQESKVDPAEVAATVVWLLSEDSPRVSGVALPVGPGMP